MWTKWTTLKPHTPSTAPSLIYFSTAAGALFLFTIRSPPCSLLCPEPGLPASCCGIPEAPGAPCSSFPPAPPPQESPQTAATYRPSLLLCLRSGERPLMASLLFTAGLRNTRGPWGRSSAPCQPKFTTRRLKPQLFTLRSDQRSDLWTEPAHKPSWMTEKGWKTFLLLGAPILNQFRPASLHKVDQRGTSSSHKTDSSGSVAAAA